MKKKRKSGLVIIAEKWLEENPLLSEEDIEEARIKEEKQKEKERKENRVKIIRDYFRNP